MKTDEDRLQELMEHLWVLMSDPYGKQDNDALPRLVSAAKLGEAGLGAPGKEARDMLAEAMMKAVLDGRGDVLRTIADLSQQPSGHIRPRVCWQVIGLWLTRGSWPAKAELRTAFMDASGNPLPGFPDYGDSKSWNRLYAAAGVDWLEHGRGGPKPKS